MSRTKYLQGVYILSYFVTQKELKELKHLILLDILPLFPVHAECKEQSSDLSKQLWPAALPPENNAAGKHMSHVLD